LPHGVRRGSVVVVRQGRARRGAHAEADRDWAPTHRENVGLGFGGLAGSLPPAGIAAYVVGGAHMKRARPRF
jgi:hypothetical protein